jgi:hypothetical protein
MDDTAKAAAPPMNVLLDSLVLWSGMALLTIRDSLLADAQLQSFDLKAA